MSNNKWGASLSPAMKERIDWIFTQPDFDSILDKTVDFFSELKRTSQVEWCLCYWLDMAYQYPALYGDNYFYPIWMMYVCMLPEDVDVHGHQDMMNRYLTYAVEYINNSQGMAQTELRCGWLKKNLMRFDEDQRAIAQTFQSIYDAKHVQNGYGYQQQSYRNNSDVTPVPIVNNPTKPYVSRDMNESFRNVDESVKDDGYAAQSPVGKQSKKPMIIVGIVAFLIGLLVGIAFTNLVQKINSAKIEENTPSAGQVQTIEGSSAPSGENQKSEDNQDSKDHSSDVTEPSESVDAPTDSSKTSTKQSSKSDEAKGESSSAESSSENVSAEGISTERKQARIYTINSETVQLRETPAIEDDNIIASVSGDAELVVEIEDDQTVQNDGHQWIKVKILEEIEKGSIDGVEVKGDRDLIAKDTSCYVAAEFLQIVE